MFLLWQFSHLSSRKCLCHVQEMWQVVMNSDIKIAFSMIVFNGSFFIEPVLEAIYNQAHQILISEGCVGYWKDKGFTTSTDGTNDIIHSFYDPDKKIKIAHGTYDEKTEQSNALSRYFQDSDYVWQLDSDEVYKEDDIKVISKLLKNGGYTSAGLKSLTFYGGFDYTLGGFERSAEFHRIGKSGPNAFWGQHRPPQIVVPGQPLTYRHHLDMNVLYERYGVQMYHYSYVSPRQVYEKIKYYKEYLSKDNCIDNYFDEVFAPWVVGTADERRAIEDRFNGVHEFQPGYRGECRTEWFTGEHPETIAKRLPELRARFNQELYEALNKQETVHWNT